MSLFTRLAYFNCVVEQGSISKASQVFDVQPSSISRQLSALEAELNVRILDRTTRNVGVTEAGLVFYQYSKRIIAEFDEAKRAVNIVHNSPKGRLKISATVAFGENKILPLLPLFRAAFPDIKVEIEITERIVDLIEENVDIAIRSGRLPDSNLIAKKLMNNHFILCASPSYLAHRSIPKTTADLAQHDCLVYGFKGWHDWYILNNKPSKIEIPYYMEINSVNGQKQLILNGGGIALLPQWAIDEELNNGKLVQLLPQSTFSPCHYETSTYAIYQHRQLVSSKVRVFLDFLSEHFS
ncbi:LysR family transcriptional regulator [Photobacterium carnosum]|uniref:LysR family transcriptional regulator n=1 Tax=Photobacterium carnosum TaxID=2023717 RepID=UPI001E5B4CE3|nr:LysR family transcriptional regulator [Photobacterium carnosum]MCD9531837.1 LysR family transcriptional regulator [Photobacterium carnosum]MCF2155764.1 LysR family transcriptional regulator [Photobacterium carnosum]MCF2217596.1 LysR family transcriptional regulator [Photobacterium carnosum]